jgi:hypothetical protein
MVHLTGGIPAAIYLQTLISARVFFLNVQVVLPHHEL